MEFFTRGVALLRERKSVRESGELDGGFAIAGVGVVCIITILLVVYL